MQKIFSRRSVLYVCYATMLAQGLAQGMGDFTSIKPLETRPDSLVIPKSHTFQYILKTGDTLGDHTAAGAKFDFTGYVPINGSTEGWLSVSSEKDPGEVAVLRISLDSTQGLWHVLNSGKVDLSSAHAKTSLGKSAFFCSGGIMPWGHVVVAEEINTAGDSNGDGYEDIGWLVEIDPQSRKVAKRNKQGMLQKLWAMGRMQHENLCIKEDLKTCYFGADSKEYGYLYKYVCRKAGDLSKGRLYVLKMSGDVQARSGVWVRVPNKSKKDRNHTDVLSKVLGATNFSGIEDVEVGPDGKIYFSAKYSGRVYRFKDDLKNGVQEHEVFVDDQMYDIRHEEGTTSLDFHAGHTGADNLAFDDAGNLWILNDGGNNGVWMAKKGHDPKSPQLMLFAESPKGSEPTGITFTPDYKFMFISFQSPQATQTQVDKAGNKVVFNTSHAVVISRK